MNSILKVVVIFCALAMLACEPEDQQFSSDSKLRLSMSKDTVLFDTVFTDQLTVTKRFKVYNPNKNALSIGQIRLEKTDSPYELIVNGEIGKTFTNHRILGNDSLQVLVRAFIDAADADEAFVVEDKVLFDYNGNQDQKLLLGWGQDAIYIKDAVVDCNSTWTSDRPYLLFGNVLVDASCNLNIEPGTEVFLHKGATLFIKGSLKTLGTADNRIRFQNDRKEAIYDAPGQWEGIYFLEGSKDNLIAYTDIKNANIGLRVGTPDEDDITDVYVRNSIVYNMAQAGVLCFTSDVVVENSLIFSCGQYTFAGLAGGNYQLLHNTLANGLSNFISNEPSVVFSNNLILDDNNNLEEDLNAAMVNGIVWGNNAEEILLSNSTNAAFTLFVSNSILKTEIAELDVNNNLLNQDPKFKAPFELNYKLDTLSPAKDHALPGLTLVDLEDILREALPDLGCYERIEN